MKRWTEPQVARVTTGMRSTALANGPIEFGLGRLRAIRHLIEGRGGDERPLLAVQIGAGDGSMEGDLLQRFLIDSGVEAHLVEAVPHLHQRLFGTFGQHAPRIQCHCVAVSRYGGCRPLFYVDPCFAESHPDRPSWMHNQIGSLTDEYLRQHVPDQFIVTTEVDSRSPADLLEEIGVAADDVDMLVVDAEGLDGEIVLGFLHVSRPELIVFEENLLPESDRSEIFDRLGQMGYVTWKSYNDQVAIQRYLLSGA